MLIAWLLVLLAVPAATTPDIFTHAAAARDAGHVDEAIRLYRKATVLRPVSQEGWWNLGTLLYEADRFKEAQAAFARFVKLQPKEAAGWAFLGLCEFETKEPDASLLHLERGLRLDLPVGEPLAKVARYHAALLLTQSGQFERALQLFAQLAVLDAGDRETVIATGIAGLRMKDSPAVLPGDKQEFAFAVGHAIREGAARRGDVARSEFEALLKRYPEAPELHNLFGQLLISSEPDAALAAWKQEIALTPGHVPARLEIAFEYLKRGDAQAALPYAREAAALEPGAFAAHNALGRILVESDDLSHGIAELEIARNLAMNSPETRVALASAYAKAGRTKDAARERAEFLRLRNERDGSGSR